MVKKWTLGAIATALGMMLFGMNVHAKDSSRPIIIPVHNWSSQVVMAYVIGGIFESIGNRVAYTPANSQAVYESIRLGDVTISHEVWQSTFGKSFYEAMAKGGIIDAGTHSATTLEEVGVPQWVIDNDLCPGLPYYKEMVEELFLLLLPHHQLELAFQDFLKEYHILLQIYQSEPGYVFYFRHQTLFS